jgi:hypothetical protein
VGVDVLGQKSRRENGSPNPSAPGHFISHVPERMEEELSEIPGVRVPKPNPDSMAIKYIL